MILVRLDSLTFNSDAWLSNIIAHDLARDAWLNTLPGRVNKVPFIVKIDIKGASHGRSQEQIIYVDEVVPPLLAPIVEHVSSTLPKVRRK